MRTRWRCFSDSSCYDLWRTRMIFCDAHGPRPQFENEGARLTRTVRVRLAEGEVARRCCAKSLQGEAPCGSAVCGSWTEMSPAPSPLPSPEAGPPPCGEDKEDKEELMNKEEFMTLPMPQVTSHCSCLEHCFLFWVRDRPRSVVSHFGNTRPTMTAPQSKANFRPVYERVCRVTTKLPRESFRDRTTNLAEGGSGVQSPAFDPYALK